MEYKKRISKEAFIRSIPIMFSYLFISMAYGMMMQKAGFSWYYSLIISLTIYTGAFQFILVSFLACNTPIITILVTALLMNSRQTFYSITFFNDFKNMGRRKLYMIHTMTDETYAVNCTLQLPKREKEDVMFYVALFSRSYWMIGTVIGAVLGQLIPFELKGIDFCMTALFVIIFIQQWEKTKNHLPAILAIVIGLACLVLFGKQNFMLPALVIVSVLLLVIERKDDSK